MLMRRGIIALRVGSLNALRRGSVLTVFFVFAFLSLLLLIILAAADYTLQANAFPGAFAIVVGLALFFIFLQWLISPSIVRWAIRQRQAITPQSNPWLYQTVAELARHVCEAKGKFTGWVLRENSKSLLKQCDNLRPA